LKKISFVSPNFQQGPKEFNAYYLPYSPAVIWSYVNQFENIKSQYELDTFIWRRDPIEEVVDNLKNNYLVGFSTYIWNKNYSYTLARELKKANPDIVIVFGGPEPPIEDLDFFKQFPYIDICVKQEGEISFKNILESQSRFDWLKIPGLIVNVNTNTVDTGPSLRINELDQIPSPYLTGVFDKLISQFPEITWNATLETNRGCPYACTFCDWGSLTYNKVKKFNLERVFAELEWIGQNQCDFVSITDANFGIFPERDSVIADKLIEVQKTYNNPKAYTISWAKNQKREIVDIVKKLIYDGGSKIGLNLSVQTLDDNVLDIIKRKNLEMNKIEEVFDMCEENNIPLYTELILGLPGETLESWKNNFYRLYRAGNHTGITVYQAQLLENAEMNLVQKKEYNIDSVVVYDYIVGTYNENEVKEGIEVVVSTRDLPSEKMIEAQVFSWFMNTFHINGLTNYISRFLFKYSNISYEEFYDGFFEHIKTDKWLKSEIERIEDHYRNWGLKGKIDHELIQGIEIHGWNLIHSTIIKMHSDNMTNHVFSIIENYLKKFNLPNDLFQSLYDFQKNYIVNYVEIPQYPKMLSTNFNILNYIIHNEDLNKESTYVFDFPEDRNISLKSYCEQIFFARRRNFGKSWITEKK
jgi:radical SAM superfamily enzyme YgiQ (UPF0313 family)